MESVSLYSEARNEYLKQLATWIVPPLVEFFRRQFSEIAAKEGKKAMPHFQTWCSEIPRWNQDVIDTNIATILDSCRCDYIEELMTAVFIAHTKMLTAIRVSTKQKKLQITLPKLDHFLHRIFVECARAFWKAPFLFLDSVSPIEMQKNVLQAEVMCTEALSSAVRSLLPIKSILRDYLEEDEPEPEPEPIKDRKKKKRKEPESDSSDSSSSDSEEEQVLAPVPSVPATAPIESQPTVGGFEDASFMNMEDKLFAPPPIHTLPEKVHEAPMLEKVASEPIEAVPTQMTAPVPEPHSEPAFESLPESVSEPVSESLPEPMPESEPLQMSAPIEPVSELVIDTKPSVHFSNYETVFDEDTPNASEIRYAPKLSVEEMPDSDWGAPPKLHVSSDAGSSLELDDVEDLEPQPKPVEPVSVQDQEDIEAPLASQSLDFEELA